MRKRCAFFLLLIAFAACKSSSDDKPPRGTPGTPPAGDFGCPPSKPQVDTPCSENTLDCVYSEPQFGCPDPVVTGETRCETGQWKAAPRDASCALPGPGCPAPEIANGFTCPGDASTGRCIYADCTGDASLVYTCVDGHLKGAGAVPSCDGGTDASDAGAD